MSYYVFNQQKPYTEYLDKQEYVDLSDAELPKIILEVSRQTLDLLATNNSLQLHNIGILINPAAEETENSDIVRLAYASEISEEAYPELLATFHWGLADRLARMGHMNERLSVLTQNTDSPEQTLAYNHFEKAREAFDQKDYSAALSEIDRAIEGDQASSGFRSEWRFYYLQGIVYLGFYGCDPELVDLEKAEEALIHATMFAKAGFPYNTALAFLAASWAAYCNGKLDKALEYVKEAEEFDPNQMESQFLQAKYKMAAGDMETGLYHLARAVDFDTFYSLKAAADGDFLTDEDKLREALERLKHNKFEKFRARVFAELNIQDSLQVQPELRDTIDRFTREKSLLELSKAEQEWNEFKIKPVFVSKEIEHLKIEHEAMVKMVEPYREKVITQPGNWMRKEQSKFVVKNRVVERKKRVKYEISLYKDTFMFFTGKVLADFNMVLVEGGTFKMGDTNSIGRIDEKPVHEVELNTFLMCDKIVTQKVWNLVMDFNPSNFHGYDLPVEHVSWYDCIEFCNRLSIMAGFKPCYSIDKTNRDPMNINKTDDVKWTVICDWEADGYRLATEAEWEYAAKGGKNSSYYKFAGGDDENLVCWHKDNSTYKTQNVGQKLSNEAGLYDMSGNVWEWCWDWYDNYLEEAVVNPKGPDKGSYKVLRGGSWADSLNYQRSAGRGKENPTGRYTSIGVRFVRKSPK